MSKRKVKTGQSVSQRLSPGHHTLLGLFNVFRLLLLRPKSSHILGTLTDFIKTQTGGPRGTGNYPGAAWRFSTSNMTRSGHVFAVKTLYRRVLALHKRLPSEQKTLGDQYAKGEFRRHKNVSKELATEFLQEWKSYADILEQQSRRNDMKGIHLQPDLVDSFREDQLVQLFELYNEATATGNNKGD